tara:strand:- start:91 stop:405 length:315 start_codon:yes stop_codon:yes gene_type:complete
MSSFKKADAGKRRRSLLVQEFINEMIDVLEFGADKYDKFNWLKGSDWSRISDAMDRHVVSFNANQDKDPETKLSHMAHVAVNAMFLYTFSQREIGNDDRKKGDK